MRTHVLVTVVFFCLPTTVANAQVKSDGKWYFPDSVRAMCINTEQGLVAQFKGLVEKNRELMDANASADRLQNRQVAEALKEGIKDLEGTWDRLGCAHILYGPDKASPVRK